MEQTKLSPRKKAVLSAIVKAYIESGEPIGSKILMGLMENAPSSATLRNEMNELCALGLLTQPHTSAGRIPTGEGYKLYVSSLMEPRKIDEALKGYIDSKLALAAGTSQNIPEQAAKLLSELTGYPALWSYMVDEEVILRQIELLPVGRRSAVLLAVTSDSRTVSRVCHLKSDLTKELIESFLSLTRERLRKKSLALFGPAFLQNTVLSAGCPLQIIPMVTELFDMLQGAAESTVSLYGASRLYNFCREESAGKIIALAERQAPLLALLSSQRERRVIFGSDTGFKELYGKALVTAKYGANGKTCGYVGIIGPDRISYENIIPGIEYTAKVLTKLMTEAAKDMED